MHRLTALTAALLLVAAVGARAQQVGPKIAYINSQAIMTQTPGAQEAETQFTQEMQVYQAELQRLSEQVDSMVQQYEQQQLTLSPNVKTQREELIVQAQQNLQNRAQQLDQQMNQRQAELVQPVMDVINQVIDQIRIEGDYALIFDVAAGSIIAADPSLDLTDEVVRRLQAQAGPAQGPSGN